MPLTGKDHGNAVAITGGDYFIIATGPARLDDRSHTRFGGAVDGIIEWEKCVGGEDGAANPIASFFQGDFDRIDAAHLAGTGSEEHPIFRDDDRVGLHKATDDPGEAEIGSLCGGGLLFGD